MLNTGDIADLGQHFQLSTAGIHWELLAFCSALEIVYPIRAPRVHGGCVSQPFWRSLTENCSDDSSADTRGAVSRLKL